MSAPEQRIDVIARAMTQGGPGADFAARVMAPIQGRPQPGFTDRVMARIDAKPQRGAMRALRPVLAGAMTFAVVALLWRPPHVASPDVPAPAVAVRSIGEPKFAITTVPSTAPTSTRGAAAHTRRTTLPAVLARATAPAPGADRPLYRIAELERPAGLAISAIDPQTPAVAPLDRPAALIVPGLRFDKEKP